MSKSCVGGNAYSNYLKKKVQKKDWKDFWVVLNGTWLFFFRKKGDESACGVLELSGQTTCQPIGTKHQYRPYRGSSQEQEVIKFKLRSKRGVHIFKTCLDEFHDWVRFISEAVKLFVHHPAADCIDTIRAEVLKGRPEETTSEEETGALCCASGDLAGWRRTSEVADRSSLSFTRSVAARSCLSFTRSVRGDVRTTVHRLRQSLRSLRGFRYTISGDNYDELN